MGKSQRPFAECPGSRWGRLVGDDVPLSVDYIDETGGNAGNDKQFKVVLRVLGKSQSTALEEEVRKLEGQAREL